MFLMGEEETSILAEMYTKANGKMVCLMEMEFYNIKKVARYIRASSRMGKNTVMVSKIRRMDRNILVSSRAAKSMVRVIFRKILASFIKDSSRMIK
jgi:sugar-specific transcriptional regulator TrmB